MVTAVEADIEMFYQLCAAAEALMSGGATRRLV